MFATGTGSTSRLVISSILILYGAIPVVAQQMADPDFDAKVAKPAFRGKGPKVLFDEAHDNFHTASGRYKPFADLMTNDGYLVTPNKVRFAPKSLEGYDILLIANALSPTGQDSAAFTDEECDAVRDWVRAGGSLLLIADHAPFGAAAENMATRFGVQMSAGFTLDEQNHEKSGNVGWLVFSRENKLLGDHTIIRGRNQGEMLRRVTTFTGQSLKGPSGSTAFLKLSDTAEDRAPKNRERRVSAAGRAQGVALKAGKGRVVVLGEAAVLSAQIIKGRPIHVGMNFPGSDNRQLALNIMHWLSGLLD